MTRVRIVQTSDLHLRPDREDRLRALDLVFQLAHERTADLVLIAGDLFDRSIDGVPMRAAVRERIERFAPRPVLLLPGNHDADQYGPDTDYGENAVLLTETPLARKHVCGIEFLGVPWQQGRTLGECLTGAPTEPRHTIVVAHGSLQDGLPGSFVGDNEDGAYMPVFLADLLRRGSYAALGHFHSGRSLIRRDGATLVAYAGSPVSTSRREIGPRGCLVVDFEPSVGVLDHEFVPLPVSFYDRVEVECMPGREQASIEALCREAVAQRRPFAQVLARLSGIALETEAALRETATIALQRAWERAAEADGGAIPADDPAASRPVFELVTKSFSTLSELPLAAELVEKIEACARADGENANPAVVQTAIQLGLSALLEVLA